MSKIIEEYYAKADVMPLFLKMKLAKLNKHPDIAGEFEHWISKQRYKIGGIKVNGYSAKDLANLSPFLDGEGAFMLLIELRETPEKAMKKIKNGFKLL